jgi:hypothetical protein
MMKAYYDPILREMRTKDENIDLGVTYQGEYSAATAYSVGESLSYNGLLYVCIQSGTGQQPDNSTAYWSPISNRGVQGIQGESGPATSLGSDSLFFDSDTNTGLLRSGEDSLAFQTGGTNALTLDSSQNALLGGNVTITGNLVVNGTTVTQNATTVEIKDNLLLINNGEVGAGVTSGSAGLEVDRGTSTNYQMMFRESDDAFVIGEVGSLQAVATREDTPNSNGIAYWNNTNQRFDTTASLVYNGGDLAIGNSSASYRLDVFEDDDVWHASFGGATNELRIAGQSTNGSQIQSAVVAGGVSGLYLNTGGGNVGIMRSSDATLEEYLHIGNSTGSNTPRVAIKLEDSGFSAPGDWNSSANGDKLIIWSSGIDAEIRHGFGISSGEGYWTKGMGSTGDTIQSWWGLKANTGTPVNRMHIQKNGTVVVGSGALATTATEGFFYIPASSGPPTGTPTAIAGRVPIHFNSTNNEWYVYNSGWKKVALS